MAKDFAQMESIFDEAIAIEKKWAEQGLCYATASRLVSDMAGADYGVFANGGWYLSKNIQDMVDWLHFKLAGQK